MNPLSVLSCTSAVGRGVASPPIPRKLLAVSSLTPESRLDRALRLSSHPYRSASASVTCDPATVVEECTLARSTSVLASEVMLIDGVISAVSLLVTLGVRPRFAAAAERSLQSISVSSTSTSRTARAASSARMEFSVGAGWA